MKFSKKMLKIRAKS